MIAAPAELPHWPRHRWLAAILLILIGQIALIFWLSTHKPSIKTAADIVPKIYLPAGKAVELPGLNNPTLFVLPNSRGFSGQAGNWLRIPARDYNLPPWIDPAPPKFSAPIERLGATLAEFIHTNFADAFALASRPEPQFSVLAPDENLGTPQSTLIIEGELAARPLLSPIKLTDWPATEILTNTVVRAGVDQEGNVFSAVLLNKSGNKEADASALAQAQAARFKPLPATAPGAPNVADTRLRWGRLIFHWHTITPASTNAPPVISP